MLLAGAAPAPDWRPLDPENTLVVSTTQGQVVVELRPEFAPKGVERVKLLAREHVYDGLQFHRVIDGFVAQTGNPDNRDGGTSKHPDLPPEFSFRLDPAVATVVVDRSDAREGFVGATPFQAVSAGEQQSRGDARLRGWGAYCPGVMGMGRQADPGTANAEIFFMRAPARRLDHEYTVVGRIVSGLEAVNAVAVGEPPKVPDLMLKVRVMADLPAAEQPRLEVLNERGAAFREAMADLKRLKGADFSICDAPVRIRPPPG
ncbi:MAG: peptidylprolyl isomerase [Phenylobacterium sp.]|nr:peptidylprolyl isomerase [Phenylobacterium sp.]MCW5758387.1 peptidylprolyl isomerase [Phenylobacterium sp.]